MNKYTIERLEQWLVGSNRALRDLNERLKWNKEETESLERQIKEQQEVIRDLEINLDILRGKKIEV